MSKSGESLRNENFNKKLVSIQKISSTSCITHLNYSRSGLNRNSLESERYDRMEKRNDKRIKG